MLARKLGTQTYPFEKNFIKAVKGQASEIQRQKRSAFVTPILVFSEAKVNPGDESCQNVYVVELAQLVPLLRRLG